MNTKKKWLYLGTESVDVSLQNTIGSSCMDLYYSMKRVYDDVRSLGRQCGIHRGRASKKNKTYE